MINMCPIFISDGIGLLGGTIHHFASMYDAPKVGMFPPGLYAECYLECITSGGSKINSYSYPSFSNKFRELFETMHCN